MANLAQTINVLQAVILTNEEKMLLTPTYHVMEMYNVHQDAKLLPVDVKVADYVLGSEKLPAVSVSASKDSLGRTHISITNIDAKKAQDVSINLGTSSFKTVSGRILTSGKLQDYNSFENPSKIVPTDFKQASIKGNTLSVKMPPFSVVVLELK
jgi:alpha-N-arabinofuranosidase